MADEYPSIRRIEQDELFKLLPYHQQAMDQGALLTYLSSLAENHNFLKGKVGDMVKLLDPAQSSAFLPTDFGESKEKFAEFLNMVRLGTITTNREYAAQLMAEIPKSVTAWEKQQKFLNLLGNTVGNKTYSKFVVASTRALIRSAIYRNHIKGTSGGDYLVGRILGFIDIKTQELWSRFSITQPGFPDVRENRFDFGPVPDQFPYWPLDSVYSSSAAAFREYERMGTSLLLQSQAFQFPLPHPSYNPDVLNDGGEKVVDFRDITGDPIRPNFYAAVINGRQPFGNFVTEPAPQGFFLTGTYFLSGGSETSSAFVNIPFSDGTSVRFEALSYGTWANGTRIDITSFGIGTWDFTFTGVRSRIKYKSSYYDVTAVVEPGTYAVFVPLLPVQPNQSGSLEDLELPDVWPIQERDIVNSRLEQGDRVQLTLDGEEVIIPKNTTVDAVGIALAGSALRVVLSEGFPRFYIGQGTGPAFGYDFADFLGTGTLRWGRTAGAYPITGSLGGSRIAADPDVHWQLDTAKLIEILASLRLMLSDTKPLTRDIRRFIGGFLFNDTVNYAPVSTLNEVILESPDETLWRLTLGDGDQISWISGDYGSASDPVIQLDRNGQHVKWKIDNSGVFSVEVVPGSSTNVLVNIIGHGWVHVSNGQLVVYTGIPEQALEQVWDAGYAGIETFFGEPIVTFGGDTILTFAGLEPNLFDDKPLVVENPPENLWPFMSDDAHSDDVPSDHFKFTRPQDDIMPRTVLNDSVAGHVADRYDENVKSGFDDAQFGYRIGNGNFFGNDFRNRATGANPGEYEAPSQYVRMDHPVRIGNAHNSFVYRDRDGNTLHVAAYKANSSGETEGAERVLLGGSQFDGPIEPSDEVLGESIHSTGAGVTPNGQSTATELSPYVSFVQRTRRDMPTAATSITNQGGNSRFHVDATSPYMAVGMKLLAVGYSTTVGTITAIGEGYFDTNLTFTATGTPSLFFMVELPSYHVNAEGTEKRTAVVTVPSSEDGGETVSVRAYFRPVGAPTSHQDLTVTPGNVGTTDGFFECVEDTRVFVCGKSYLVRVERDGTSEVVDPFAADDEPELHFTNLYVYYGDTNEQTTSTLNGSFPCNARSGNVITYEIDEDGWSGLIQYDSSTKEFVVFRLTWNDGSDDVVFLKFSDDESPLEDPACEPSIYMPQIGGHFLMYDEDASLKTTVRGGVNKFRFSQGAVSVNDRAAVKLYGGGERDAAQITLTDSNGDSWVDFMTGGVSPDEPVGDDDKPWFRGGAWDAEGPFDRTTRTQLPDVLELSP